MTMELMENVEIDEYGLKGKAWLPLQNKYIRISMENAKEVTEHHIYAVESVQKIDEGLRLHLQNSLYKACESFKYVCGQIEPVIKKVEDIWEFVNIFEIRLGEEFINENYSHIIIGLSGSWEEEHAYEAVIRDYKTLEYLGGFLCYPANSYADIPANEGNYALL